MNQHVKPLPLPAPMTIRVTPELIQTLAAIADLTIDLLDQIEAQTEDLEDGADQEQVSEDEPAQCDDEGEDEWDGDEGWPEWSGEGSHATGAQTFWRPCEWA